MHNWSLALTNKEEDSSGIAFETAKACIFGLADICCIASSVAPTSAVIRGIRSTVFQNVLTFFVALFEGNDVLKMIDKNFLNMQDNPEVFSELKQKVSDEDDSSSTKLSKFRALCILRVFFSYPKELLAACLELLGSTTKEGSSNEGQRFLSMVTSMLNYDEADHLLGRANDGPKSCNDSIEEGVKEIEVGEKAVTDDNHISDAIQKSCLLMLPRKQPNGNDCGYYVMKNMLDIISANITKSWMEVFNDPTSLTDDDLYDLRNQWATCFLDLFKA